MYKRNTKKKLGVKASHRGLLVKNLVRSLFKSGVVVTTTSRAKVLSQNVQSLIVKVAKANNPRNLQKDMNELLGDRKLVDSTMEYLGKGEAKVKSVKIGYRPGDNAQKTKVELVGFRVEKAAKNTPKENADKKEEKKVVKTSKVGLQKNTKGGKVMTKAAGKTARSRTRSGL